MTGPTQTDSQVTKLVSESRSDTVDSLVLSSADLQSASQLAHHLDCSTAHLTVHLSSPTDLPIVTRESTALVESKQSQVTHVFEQIVDEQIQLEYSKDKNQPVTLDTITSWLNTRNNKLKLVNSIESPKISSDIYKSLVSSKVHIQADLQQDFVEPSQPDSVPSSRPEPVPSSRPVSLPSRPVSSSSSGLKLQPYHRELTFEIVKPNGVFALQFQRI